MVSDEILCSIRSLAEYIEATEAIHFEESSDEEQKTHVYLDAVTVRKWLDSESDPLKIECPQCKEKTLEIHGEGITSEEKHYPMEQCKNCCKPCRGD